MGQIFGKEKPLKEVLRENKRMINRAVRELDREKAALEREEKRLQIEIKKAAKENQMGAVKIMAKVCVVLFKLFDVVIEGRTVGWFGAVAAGIETMVRGGGSGDTSRNRQQSSRICVRTGNMAERWIGSGKSAMLRAYHSSLDDHINVDLPVRARWFGSRQDGRSMIIY